MDELCPICHVPASLQSGPGGADSVDATCPRCGSFRISRTAIVTLPNTIWQGRKDGQLFGATEKPNVSRDIQLIVSTLSYSIRQMSTSDSRPEITTETIEKIIATAKLPSISEQRKKLLHWLAANVPSAGEGVVVNPWSVGGVIGASDNAIVASHLATLAEDGLTQNQDASWALKERTVYGTAKKVCLTTKGWEKTEDFVSDNKLQPKAFMAMKFGDAELDDLVDIHLREAVESAGFILTRIDDKAEAGLIDERMRREIRESRLLIADLTHANAGAYWEAGFAEGLGKKVIYICRKDIFDDPEKGPHFDINHHLTLTWDSKDPEKIRRDLARAIKDTFPNGK